jgi:hypothetical protein
LLSPVPASDKKSPPGIVAQTGADDGRQHTQRRQCPQGRRKKRTQLKTKLSGATAWTKRSKTSGEFMAVKKAAKNFKGVRREK